MSTNIDTEKEITIDIVHNQMLDEITDDYQKTEGFPTYDLTRGMAFAVLSLWNKAKDIERKQNIDNLEGSELTRFAAQRKGTQRRAANYAKGQITIIEGSGTIHRGDLFASESGLKYKSLETKDVVKGSKVYIECTTAGEIGNVAVGSITQMPVTITGISSIRNEELIVGGEDEESDDDLRERYYEDLREPATSGNTYHYKKWAKEVAGVGEANVIGLWNGDNTVKVVIIDSDRGPASSDLVERVQQYIDPESKGIGEGQAPTGAYCTVVSATAIPINIHVQGVRKAKDSTKSKIEKEIREKVTEYLKRIAFKQSFVSVAQIGSIIIGLEEVEDYDSYTVNNGTSKIPLNKEQVAVIGAVEVTING